MEHAGATQLKDLGNQAFKQKNYPEAIRKYTGTLDILDQMDGARGSALPLSLLPLAAAGPELPCCCDARRGMWSDNGVQ